MEQRYNIVLWGDTETSGKKNLYTSLGAQISLGIDSCYRDIRTHDGNTAPLNIWHTLGDNGVDDGVSAKLFFKCIEYKIFAIAICFEMRNRASYTTALDEIIKLRNSGIFDDSTHILLVATPTNQTATSDSTHWSYEENLKSISIEKYIRKFRFVNYSHEDKVKNTQNLMGMIKDLIYFDSLGKYPSIDFFVGDHLLSDKFLQEALDNARETYVEDTLLEFRKSGKRETINKRMPKIIKPLNSGEKLLELLCGEGNDTEDGYKNLVCNELFDINVLFSPDYIFVPVEDIRVSLFLQLLVKNNFSNGNCDHNFNCWKNILLGLTDESRKRFRNVILQDISGRKAIDLNRLYQNLSKLRSLVGEGYLFHSWSSDLLSTLQPHLNDNRVDESIGEEESSESDNSNPEDRQSLLDELNNELKPKKTSTNESGSLSGSRAVMFAFEEMYKKAGSPKTLKKIDKWTEECLSDEALSEYRSVFSR